MNEKDRQKRSQRCAACIALVGLWVFVIPASASIPNLEDREQGWFWYDDPELIEEPEEEIDEAPEIPLALASPDETDEEKPDQDQGPEVMSTAWIRENLPIALERAMDDPTRENLLVFGYLQRAAFDKAERFAYSMRDVVMTDPLLDENNRAPISIAANRALRQQNEDIDSAKLEWLADEVGFFYFHDEACQYCQLQVPILERLSERYGFRFLAIGVGGTRLENTSLDSRVNEGQAETLEVSRVPAIVMVWPPDNAAVITQSFVPASSFRSRVIATAREVGVLTDEIRAELGAEDEILFTDLDLNDPDDLYQWVQNIRREMGYEAQD